MSLTEGSLEHYAFLIFLLWNRSVYTLWFSFCQHNASLESGDLLISLPLTTTKKLSLEHSALLLVIDVSTVDRNHFRIYLKFSQWLFSWHFQNLAFLIKKITYIWISFICFQKMFSLFDFKQLTDVLNPYIDKSLRWLLTCPRKRFNWKNLLSVKKFRVTAFFFTRYWFCTKNTCCKFFNIQYIYIQLNLFH